ncbi:anthrone oxygenase family protein [Variovorax sp. UC122_21]|uniref:anthrone oxygenase family protein n=1 Tax=Variovorax sp. UC122_21 TaxID=3374554 RepID=UPI003756A21E
MPSRTSPISFALFSAGWSLHGLAVFAFGLMAGFFWTYGFNVSLATAHMDGASYAVVQSSLNRHVRHAMFFGFFFGPPVLCALALAAGRDEWRRGWFGLLAFAGVLYALGIVLFTAQVNLPLNAYTESWDPRALPPDWAETRARWNAANLWRCAASALAFALSIAALALRARAVADATAARVPVTDATDRAGSAS